MVGHGRRDYDTAADLDSLSMNLGFLLGMVKTSVIMLHGNDLLAAHVTIAFNRS